MTSPDELRGLLAGAGELRPGTLTVEQVPDWVKLDHAEYVRRREEEIDSALWSAKTFNGDWISYAASMLHTIGSMAPEYGSHHHACLIVSDALAAQSDRLTLLEAERERLREALEPFAAICPAVEKTKARDGNVCHRQFLDDGSRVELTIADFQRAHTTYATLPQGEG